MKRFKANGNGCPAYQGEEARYFFDTTDFSLVKCMPSYKQFIRIGLCVAEYQKSNYYLSEFYEYHPSYIEVTADDLPYLEIPEGEWEFREVDGWEIFVNKATLKVDTFCGHAGALDYSLDGCRWVKPRKADAFQKWWDGNGVQVCYEALTGKSIAKSAWEACENQK